MAAYKSGFDPPTRPGDKSGSRIPVGYAHPGLSSHRSENRDVGYADARRGQPVTGRSQQTVQPRPGMRDPSSSTGPPTEPKEPRAGTASRFGFGKSNTKGALDGPVPELRSKSSRNNLRRKPSLVSQHSGGPLSALVGSDFASPTKRVPAVDQRPSIEASAKSMEAYNEIFARTSSQSPAIRNTPRIIPELDRYRPRPEQHTSQSNKFHAEVPKLATHDLPPPTPPSGTPGASGISGGSGGSGSSWTPIYPAASNNYNRYSGYSGYSGSGYSASPSTRFSESPGPGAYSRDTTPTSMASQSPGVIAPSKTPTPRLRQGSPAFSRPPVTRRRAGSIPTDAENFAVDTHGLPSLQESVTSSSSNSTVKGGGTPKNSESAEKKKKKKGLSPLPPSPPPRKSSQKSTESSPTDKRLAPKSSKDPAQATMIFQQGTSPLKPPNVFSHKHSTSSSSTSSNAPVRPSREGIPSLQSQLGGSVPVIQSNLAGLTYAQDKQGRRQSITPLNDATSLQNQSPYLNQSGSRLTSRNASPAPAQFASQEATPAPSGLGIIPDLRPSQAHPITRSSATRTPSPTPVNPRPRFGFFTRRTKTAPGEISTNGSTEKAPRKGPAAGTGHEGYGKYGPRGRSSSSGGLGTNWNRSTSAASSAESVASSTRTHDPFLLDRMSPVIIAGGGVILENRNASTELSRTESGTSLILSSPSTESKTSSNLGHEVSRATLWPSALPRDPTNRVSTSAPRYRRPSDSSDDGMNKPSSLAFRRSIQRLNNSTGELILPKPLNLSSMGVSPSVRSLESSAMDSSIMSDGSQMDLSIDADRGRKGSRIKPKKLEKRNKSPRKWNLFHRSQPKGEPQVQEALPVTVGRPPVKTVPHYAMLDSSDEQLDVEQMDLGEILRDAEVVELAGEELDALQFNNYKENIRRIQDLQLQMHTQTPLSLPERSPMIFSSPEPMHSTPELTHSQPHISNESTPSSAPTQETELHLTQDTAPVRPSRLPQVGRIPKVISARPETTSPKSFSRPFARLSTLQSIQGPIAIDQNSVALGSGPPENVVLESPGGGTQSEVLHPRQDSKDSSADSLPFRQFLAFSARKDSEATTSSSGAMSFAGTTAVIPEADAALDIDEVWDEYDDLITNKDTAKAHVSTTSSRGMPFQYESYESRKAKETESQPNESPTVQAIGGMLVEESTTKHSSADGTFRSSQLTVSSMHSADMATRMKALLVTVPSPTAPISVQPHSSPLYDDVDSAKTHERPLQSGSSKYDSASRTGAGSGLVAIKEPENSSPISQVNLRVGSMTVSKWLTFGHVLFSPAREEILNSEGSSKAPSVLVIDGLGNDDWSFYAAETYPKATFYNLSPTRPLPASHRLSINSSFPMTPRNHRQIQYLSTSHKFPFPSSFFNVVVFRFPSAMSESAYRNLISESKRVLKPSGYLEMAILDLDMMNMGNRARRAVRGLKVRIQVADPNISIGSASDVVLKMVGKRGFTDIKTCNVGVPVASAVPSSASSKLTANSKEPEDVAKEEMSLADMMRDESQAADEGITKMVAKVGRWWYARCYESVVLPNGEVSGSVLNDEALLHECEKWNANFKLAVAYAQKPVQGRRRTASV